MLNLAEDTFLSIRVIGNHTKCLKKQCHGSIASEFKDVINIFSTEKIRANFNYEKTNKVKTRSKEWVEIYIITT